MREPAGKTVPRMGQGRRLLAKVRRTVVAHKMVRPGERIVLSVSGGIDSMTLVDVFSRLAGPWELGLVIGHVNHGLRGEESERDMRFVQEQALKYRIPVEVRKLGKEDYPAGENLQASARRLRYRFLDEIAEKWGAGRIATGHNRDDHVETLLMQIFRGAGGLWGIPASRGERYIRPLLDASRAEIEAYVTERNLSFCEDSSNQKPLYLRNRIRREFLPWLRKEVNPQVDERLAALAALSREESAFLDRQAREALGSVRMQEGKPGEVVLDRQLFLCLDPVLQRRILRILWADLAGSPGGVGYGHLHVPSPTLQRHLGGPARRFQLPGGLEILLEEARLRLRPSERCVRPAPYSHAYVPGETLWIPEAGLKVRSRWVHAGAFAARGRPAPWEAFLDESVCLGEMRFRSFRPGDRFVPLGIQGEKKLKDFFIDEKVAPRERLRVPLLEVGERIAWVVGFRIDDRFKVLSRTARCLHLVAEAAGDGPQGSGPLSFC